IRSYGKDPKLVARYGVARISGMAKGGLSSCPKHFPGKGHSPLDAHLKLPTILSDWDEMHAVHLVPFLEAIAAGVECLMTSHPVYPRLDPSGVPATFSRLIVEDYLRSELGFRGVIVSDDLEMGAVSETCPIGDACGHRADARSRGVRARAQRSCARHLPALLRAGRAHHHRAGGLRRSRLDPRGVRADGRHTAAVHRRHRAVAGGDRGRRGPRG